MIISHNTVHQLSEYDFGRLVDSTKYANPKSKLRAQRTFEQLVIERGDSLSEDYVYDGNQQKVSIVCSGGHVYQMTPNSYKRGQGCAKCSGLCPDQAKENFHNVAKCRGDVITGEYLGNKTKVDMLCKNGHKFTTKPNQYVSRGDGCARCSGNCPEQARERFFESVKSRGDVVIGKYTNTAINIDMMCKNGHKFSMAPRDYRRMHGCHRCAKYGFDKNKVGYVYVMRSTVFKNDIIKIGISNKPDIRTEQLKNATPFEFNRIELFKFDDGQNAYNTEQLAHKMRERYQFDGRFDGHREWFEYNMEQIDFIRSKFKQQNHQPTASH